MHMMIFFYNLRWLKSLGHDLMIFKHADKQHGEPDVCVFYHQVGGDGPGDHGEGRIAWRLPKEAHIRELHCTCHQPWRVR